MACFGHFGCFLALFDHFWLLLVGKLSKEISDWIRDQNIVKLNHPKFVRYNRKQTCCGRILFYEISYLLILFGTFQNKIATFGAKNSESQPYIPQLVHYERKQAYFKIIFVGIWYLWCVLVILATFWHFSTIFGYFW